MIRLAPYIAQRAPLSRRQAEHAIKMGRIAVDGVVVTEFYAPTFEKIALDGVDLLLPPPPKMWIYYKPVGELVTRFDPQGRPTVFDAVRPQLPEGPLVCVGRLDYESEGLLLLTNAPAVAHSLEKGRLHRCYRVWLRGQLTDDRIQELEKGMTIDDIYYRPCRVMVERQNDGHSQVLVTLTEGKKREIRVLMSAIRQHVTRLMRISFGTFRLGGLTAGNLVQVPDEDVTAFLNSIAEEKKRNAERSPERKDRVSLKMSTRPKTAFSQGAIADRWAARSPRAEGSGESRPPRPYNSEGRSGPSRPWAARTPRTEGSSESRPPRPYNSESRPWAPRTPRAEGSGESRGGPSRPWAPRTPRTEGSGESRPPRPYNSESRPWAPRTPRAEGSGESRPPRPYNSESRPWAPRTPRAEGSGESRPPRPYNSESRPPRPYNSEGRSSGSAGGGYRGGPGGESRPWAARPPRTEGSSESRPPRPYNRESRPPRPYNSESRSSGSNGGGYRGGSSAGSAGGYRGGGGYAKKPTFSSQPRSTLKLNGNDKDKK